MPAAPGKDLATHVAANAAWLQATLNGALTGVAVVAVVVNETISDDTPETGTIKILLDVGTYREVSYTSWIAKTFTIPSTDFSSSGAADGNTVEVTATLGTNCFDGPIRPPEAGVPERAVFFIESGGPAAEPDNGVAKETAYPTVQVWARSDDDDYAGGKTWKDSIYDAIEHAAISGYINVRNLRIPTYMGMDEGRRHEWSWEAEMIHEELL